MNTRRLITLASLMAVFAMVAAACATPTPQTIVQTAPPVVQTSPPQVVEVTRVVGGTPQTVVITATPEPAKPAETVEISWYTWATGDRLKLFTSLAQQFE